MFLKIFFFLPAFAFPWCMTDGERGGCCWRWHIWSLWLIFFERDKDRHRSAFLSVHHSEKWLLLSFKRFLQVILVTVFDLLRCCSVSEQFRNDYWSSWKMHDTPCFMSHKRFPDSFSDCADTFCCMSDQDLFWHLWKFIVFLKLHLQCWSV